MTENWIILPKRYALVKVSKHLHDVETYIPGWLAVEGREASSLGRSLRNPGSGAGLARHPRPPGLLRLAAPCLPACDVVGEAL